MFTVTGFCDDTGKYAVDDPKGLAGYIRQHFTGREFTLTVKAKTSKRSLAQNAWHWGVALPLIAEHLGYDRHEHDQLHYDLLAVRFGTKAIPPLLPGAPPRIEPQRTSSELTTQEFSDYMDWLVRYAAQEFGVVIPLPDEEAA
jgi:hypothetical protein